MTDANGLLTSKNGVRNIRITWMKKLSKKTHTGNGTMVRRAYVHIKKALPDMVHYLDNPRIPKTTNALESFFGHLKENITLHRGMSYQHYQNYVKWYLSFLFIQRHQPFLATLPVICSSEYSCSKRSLMVYSLI